MTSAARPYGGMPSETRRLQRRARLLDAVFEVVGVSGFGALTVASVCAAAGVGKRYFYESFASLDELVAGALQQIFEQVGLAIEESGLQPDDPAERLLELAARSALEVLDDPRVARFYLESTGSPAGMVVRETAVGVLTEQLLVRLVGTGPPRPTARLLGHLLVAGTNHVVALWLRGESGVGREDLITMLVGIGVDAAERMRLEA
ncbi:MULTISPECIES: TetR/AcrR family transcriptional regulator [Nocardia]|uniref:TetR/AcrR family transcriptional regulator n=1 Tax=Nocardia aurea TaxID=2144174 RepID=A0ABV3FTA2_9NOCA|nr:MULTISPECIES: TetR/AcrR family transcriptional regulator [Nocardia]